MMDHMLLDLVMYQKNKFDLNTNLYFETKRDEMNL